MEKKLCAKPWCVAYAKADPLGFEVFCGPHREQPALHPRELTAEERREAQPPPPRFPETPWEDRWPL